MRYDQVERLVFNEYAASVEKHGDWSDYSIDQMMSVIIHELMMEAGDALQRGDLHGEHGVIRELLQVAACCHKAVMVLSRRANATLAETLQPAGLHSEGRGCDLPPSPPHLQGKENATNCPEGPDYA